MNSAVKLPNEDVGITKVFAKMYMTYIGGIWNESYFVVS